MNRCVELKEEEQFGLRSQLGGCNAMNMDKMSADQAADNYCKKLRKAKLPRPARSTKRLDTCRRQPEPSLQQTVSGESAASICRSFISNTVFSICKRPLITDYKQLTLRDEAAGTG